MFSCVGTAACTDQTALPGGSTSVLTLHRASPKTSETILPTPPVQPQMI